MDGLTIGNFNSLVCMVCSTQGKLLSRLLQSETHILSYLILIKNYNN
jgi:hypothetical protein